MGNRKLRTVIWVVRCLIWWEKGSLVLQVSSKGEKIRPSGYRDSYIRLKSQKLMLKMGERWVDLRAKEIAFIKARKVASSSFFSFLRN